MERDLSTKKHTLVALEADLIARKEEVVRLDRVREREERKEEEVRRRKDSLEAQIGARRNELEDLRQELNLYPQTWIQIYQRTLRALHRNRELLEQSIACATSDLSRLSVEYTSSRQIHGEVSNRVVTVRQEISSRHAEVNRRGRELVAEELNIRSVEADISHTNLGVAKAQAHLRNGQITEEEYNRRLVALNVRISQIEAEIRTMENDLGHLQ